MYKFSIDKRFTTIEKVSAVKAASKQMKAVFMENDLLEMFNNETGEMVRGRVLETKVEGYSSSIFNDNVSFSVEMLIYNDYIEFYHVLFFIEYDAEKDSFAFVTNDSVELASVRTFVRN